jgi:mono/diheme cytochrome c family protein
LTLRFEAQARGRAALVVAALLHATGAVRADPPARDRAAIADGLLSYQRYCAWCHGERGDGRGPSARRLDPPPRDFTQAAFKCRTTPSGELPTDEDLRRSIGRGVPGTAMPAWSVLGAGEIDDLVASIKQFSPRFDAEGVPAAIAVPPEPARTVHSVERGRAVYQRAQCARCHGPAGHGDGPAAATAHSDSGLPMRVADLTRGGDARCGEDPARLYVTILTGMNGTPMPSFAASITPEEAWDLVHFLISLRGRAPKEAVQGSRPASSTGSRRSN